MARRMRMKNYRLFVFLSIYAVLLVLTAACKSKAAQYIDMQIAVDSLLETGKGIAKAPSYDDGSDPHKLSRSSDFFKLRDANNKDLFGPFPDEWMANSISELQLCLKASLTVISTGRRQDYIGSALAFMKNPPGSPYELLHQTLTLTLLEARTGKVIATKVIDGDGNFATSFSTYGAKILPSGVAGVGDELRVNDSVVFDWLRPFIFKQAEKAKMLAEEAQKQAEAQS